MEFLGLCLALSMTVHDLKQCLRKCPIVASVQASPGSPTSDPDCLSRLALASQLEGVQIVRLEGSEAITAVRARTGLPTIGLIKRTYPGSEVYITPTAKEVRELLALGVEVIALDATSRFRPHNESVESLIDLIHHGGCLALADCDSLDSVKGALAYGADVISTTLSGYTDGSPSILDPDIELVRQAKRLGAVVLGEGRYSQPEEALFALQAGAIGVVVGGALNDPIKQTRAFVSRTAVGKKEVGAIDIGGTWLRFGLFGPDWSLIETKKVPLPEGQADRLDWIRDQARDFSVDRLGISTGGTVDPKTGIVVEAKPVIPNHVGTCFKSLGDVVALNDGLATAWGHACHPDFAGTRVATIALGTGVGFGLVERGRILLGRGGEYPRLNDLVTQHGQTVEALLGGAAMGPNPSVSDREMAQEVCDWVIQTAMTLYYPDHFVVCGGVGLAPWLSPGVPRSPFGQEAGLFGAAALALFMPSVG